MADLVSILIPCYNARKWLKETVESALSQTWSDKEIIIVDDGSTDNSLHIARQYESKIVKVISQDNKGAAAARNKAFAYAQGDYIQWLDADDLIAPDKIEIQMREAQRLGNPKILFSSSWTNFYYRHDKAKFVPDSLWRDLDPVEWLVTKFNEYTWMFPNVWLVSRQLTEQAGPWDERLSLDDDGEYFARLVTASEKIKFVREAKSYHRKISFQSLGASISDKALESHFLSKTSSIGHLLSLEDSERTRAACCKSLQYDLVFYYQLEHAGMIEKANNLARELGGALSPPSLNWKRSISKKVFGDDFTRRTGRFLWELGILIRANWDKLLYKLSV